MKKTSIIAIALALVMSLTLLTACGQSSTSKSSPVSGGVLVLSVNPEIAVEYNEKGIVTGITARNDDALAIINNQKGLIGQPARSAVAALVAAIGKAGYFVEEVEGAQRQITIEIEKGSQLPHNSFLDEVISDVRSYVQSNGWKAPLNVKSVSDYGIADYNDTDYGKDNDGVTDYSDTDYGPNNDGVTDYNDTDYGPNNDGITDYNDTDYGKNNDGITDYNDTDYGPNNDGVTDYSDTDYGPNNDGVTDYSDTDYGPNNDGVTDYNDTDYGPNNDGVTDYSDSNDNSTDYKENDSNYGN